MKFSRMSQAASKLAIVSLLLAAGLTHAADSKVEVPLQAASAVSAERVAPKVTPGKVVPKVTTGTIAGKGGENQYPSGTIPLPPKPKKEGLDAAAATKVKAAQP